MKEQMMRNLKRIVCSFFCVLFALIVSVASAAETPVTEKILDILKSNGQITEQQYDDLLQEARKEAKETSTAEKSGKIPDWVNRLTFYGDFRGRMEHFDFDSDPATTNTKPVSSNKRTRLRYRARFGVKAKVNEQFDVKIGLASGNDVAIVDATSRNVTFGNSTGQYGPDSFDLDQAYFAYHPFAGKDLSYVKKLDLRFGKVNNIFKSKEGKDYLIWDGDITPEGIDINYAVNPSDSTTLGLRAGYFVEKENSSTKDPHVLALQAQTDWRATDTVNVGGMVSYYAWRSLTDSFLTTAQGPLLNLAFRGLTDDSSIDLVDFRGWVKCGAGSAWPAKLYGNYLINTSAVKTGFTGNDKEDTAWSIGLEVGDAKKFVKLGAAYLEVEQNATLRSMTDSDLFDARTNRKGWALYGKRNLAKHVDFKLTLFSMDVLDKDVFYAVGDKNAERLRLQTDIVLKF